MPGMVTSDAASVLHRANTQRKSKEETDKKAAEDRFHFDCVRFKLPTCTRQWKLLKSVQTPRKDLKPIPKVWRFDGCFDEWKVIVEIDGGIWMPGGGAHSHPIDITRNMTKQNDAALAGYVVLRFTPREVFNEHAIAFTQHVLYARGWRR